MTKEEQIKEMFNIIADGVIESNNSILTRNTCASIAKVLYAEGYRKQSEIANEIFEEIDNIIYNLRDCPFYSSSDAIYELAELKKKYMEG